MLIEWMHLFLNNITDFLVILLELMGVFVIAVGDAGIWRWQLFPGVYDLYVF